MVRSRVVEDGIEFFDGVENAHVHIAVDSPTSITPRDTEGFPVPVDNAFSVRSSRFALESVPTIVIRGTDGTPQGPVKRLGRTSRSAKDTVLEICTPLKLYLQTDTALTITCGDGRTEISLDCSDRVAVGLRVPRKRPRETVTLTDSVSDIFAAVNTFGAAMATFSPGRSFPTIRNHPPLLTFGEQRAIPASCASPDTGIVLEAPGNRLHAAMAAPITYYLGATLRPGREGRLLVDGSPVYRMGSGRTFASACGRLIRRMVLLDSAIAAEQRYGIITEERSSIEAVTEIDWSSLSDMALSDRVLEYLAVPEEIVTPHLPEPFQPVYVSPTPAAVESLPYLSFHLAEIRPAVGTQPQTFGEAIPDGGTFGETRGDTSPSPTLPRSGRAENVTAIGHDLPVGRHPAYPAAFRNEFRTTRDTGSIAITVVCNHPKMARERDMAKSMYTSRSAQPIDIQIHENVTRAQLEDILATQTDYVHFIGHIEDTGFVCSDGNLDTRTLDAVDVELAFLNSCSSLDQALALIDAGACGGIATHHRVPNRGAISLGAEIAEALTRGYPLGVALSVTQATNAIGEKYTIVGDPKADIARTDSGIPYTCHLRAIDDDRFAITMETHLTTSVGPGSLCTFHLGEDVPYCIHPTKRTFEIDRGQLLRFLELEEVPVRFDGRIQWSRDCIELLTS